jgi:putative addiction module killer protein
MFAEKRTLVFNKWFAKLSGNVQDIVDTYIHRLLFENFSNVKPIGKGISEIKIDFQKGYRIYFTILNNKKILLLLAGGTKSGNQKQQ